MGQAPARLSEILSRSFVINFDLAYQASDCFLESEVISAIQQNWDLILSAVMKRTSHVLAMIRDGAQKQVMRLLHRTMPTHGKRRCNDLDVIRDAGFAIDLRRNAHTQNFEYRISANRGK